MRRSAIALGLLLLFAVGCQTRAIPEPDVIRVPGGLSEQNVEIAVLAALRNQIPPRDYDPRVEMTPEAFEDLVWSSYLAEPRNRGWVVDERRPYGVTAKIERTRYFLRVLVSFDARQVKVSIVDSLGLFQSETRIHRKAVSWIQRLEQRIREQLARMVAAKG